jgi:hypothetical protein
LKSENETDAKDPRARVCPHMLAPRRRGGHTQVSIGGAHMSTPRQGWAARAQEPKRAKMHLGGPT